MEAVNRTPETVGSLLIAGEDVVAYETLCDNLCQDDTVATAQLLHSLSWSSGSLLFTRTERRPLCHRWVNGS